ncbi:MAG: hypothetical protein R3297_11125 [Desulfobulbales bacterium]|nr:hypothetical protein [Desulfobulbales bacterium]
MMKRLLFLLSLLVLLVLPLVSHAEEKEPAEDPTVTITGRVLNEAGEVLPGGVVSFFDTSKGIPPQIYNTHRIPDMVGRMGKGGKFSIKLMPGSYYLGALVITDRNRGPGPPRKGETFYFARDKNGALRKFKVETKKDKNVGDVIGAKPETFPQAKSLVVIEGRLVLENGKPFVGGIVLAKTDMSKQRPDFVSERTGADGRYELKLPAGTPYYLVARERVVGRPVPGTFVGTFGSDSPISLGGALPIGNKPPGQPASGMPEVAGMDLGPGSQQPPTVTGRSGETISGADIKMFMVPVPGQQREKLQGTLGFGELESGEGETKPAEAEKK